MNTEFKFLKVVKAKGYKARALKQLETPRGVSATWEVTLDNKLLATCYDAGDGSCLTYKVNKGASIKELQTLCEQYFGFEPVENGLIILSCEGALL